MAFKPGFKPPVGAERGALWFAFCNDRIFCNPSALNAGRPYFTDIGSLPGEPILTHYLGIFNDRPCYAAAYDRPADPTDGLQVRDLRSLLGIVDEQMLALAGRGRHLIDWSLNHRFCGRCGSPMQDKTDELAKFCSRCGRVNYPRISPAVIVAVVRDRQILLARSRRARKSFYSVLAGFVEATETLEDCVQREVAEEVGIDVQHIRYFGSQPWPFPDQLMVGFTAEYAGGKIRVDPKEIVDAGWFDARHLPPVPGKYSIARRLIDWFVETYT
jgi:NAD+ diphosphatase